MKPFLYIFILLLCSACQHTKSGDATYNYVLSYKVINYYMNEYNDKGLLTKQTNHIRTTTPYGTMIDVSEEKYYYDQRDSLSEIRRYLLEQKDQSQRLTTIGIFTDSTVQTVRFFKYPNDTTSYSLRKKDKDGNIIEEYDRQTMEPDFSETRSFTTYENGRISSTIREDLLEKTVVKRIYKYEMKGDTLFTCVYDYNKLDFQSKKYVDVSSGITMEVSRNFDREWLYVDSVFIEKRKRRSISYYPDGKIIDKVLYDEHDNKIQHVSETWDRIALTE